MRNLDNDIASVCGVRGLSHDIRNEAWRLASSTPNPNPGATGWRRRWAEQLVDRATISVTERDAERTALIVAQRAADAEARAAATAARAEREAEKRAALIAAGAAAGGFGLRDTNVYHYNCGHYPNWVVVAGGPYRSIEEAESAAERKNAASAASWHAFLNA